MTEGWHRAKVFAIAPASEKVTIAFEMRKPDGYPLWRTREIWRKDYPDVLKNLKKVCGSPDATEAQLVGKQLDIYIVPPSEVTSEEIITRLRSVKE